MTASDCAQLRGASYCIVTIVYGNSAQESKHETAPTSRGRVVGSPSLTRGLAQEGDRPSDHSLARAPKMRLYALQWVTIRHQSVHHICEFIADSQSTIIKPS